MRRKTKVRPGSERFQQWMTGTFVCLGSVLLLGGCGDTGSPMPPPLDVQPEQTLIVFDAGGNSGGDSVKEEVCKVLWTKVLGGAGGMTHPARGKQDVLFVTAGMTLYALSKTGTLLWTWPNKDDTEGEIVLPGELSTPVVGREGAVYVGTYAGESPEGREAAKLFGVDKNGHTRLALDLDGAISAAPAIGSDYSILVATDTGALYRFTDTLGKQVWWERSGTDGIVDPKPGVQPVVGPKEIYGEETMLVLGLRSLNAFRAQDGKPLWKWQLPEGYEATSNGILDSDGRFVFVAARDKKQDYYSHHRVFTVLPEGVAVEPEGVEVCDLTTLITTLSQGHRGSLLMGSKNAGLLAFDTKSGKMWWHFVPEEQNFEDVAHPVQGEDGLIYFGAARHWLYVVNDIGQEVWHIKLEAREEQMGAILWPSSPLLLKGGIAVFHSSSLVHAVQCSTAGPSSLIWPRFGGNDRNSGNVADKFAGGESS